LLRAFAREIGPSDGVQLVVYAPDADPAELEARLGPAVAAAGLDGDDAPEIVAVAVPRRHEIEAELAARPRRLYARHDRRGAFHGLPRVSDFRADLLRILASQQPPDNFLLLTFDSCRYDVLRDARTPVLDRYARIVRAQTPANFTYAAHQAFFVGLLPNALEDLPYYNRFSRQLLRLAEAGEAPILR